MAKLASQARIADTNGSITILFASDPPHARAPVLQSALSAAQAQMEADARALEAERRQRSELQVSACVDSVCACVVMHVLCPL